MDDKERLRHLLKILSFDSNDNNNYKPTEKLTIDDLIQNHGISNILDHIGEDKIQDYLRIKKINKINRRN